MTDEELAEAYRRFGTVVLRRCLRLLRDDSEAEDALQDTFMKLWRYGRAYAQAESKLLWLYRVADRCCFDRLGRRPRSTDQLDRIAESAAAADGRPGWERVEDGDLLDKLLGAVDDRMRRIAVLYYVDDMSQEEIATETGWSRQTINKQLGKLKQQLGTLRARLSGGPA